MLGFTFVQFDEKLTNVSAKKLQNHNTDVAIHFVNTV
jgi:hypothetical protein